MSGRLQQWKTNYRNLFSKEQKTNNDFCFRTPITMPDHLPRSRKRGWEGSLTIAGNSWQSLFSTSIVSQRNVAYSFVPISLALLDYPQSTEMRYASLRWCGKQIKVCQDQSYLNPILSLSTHSVTLKTGTCNYQVLKSSTHVLQLYSKLTCLRFKTPVCGLIHPTNRHPLRVRTQSLHCLHEAFIGFCNALIYYS